MSNPFFKKLKKSIEEMVAYKCGKLKLEARTFIIPDPPAEYKPQQIKKIRETGHYSQSMFAKVLNVRCQNSTVLGIRTTYTKSSCSKIA